MKGPRLIPRLGGPVEGRIGHQVLDEVPDETQRGHVGPLQIVQAENRRPWPGQLQHGSPDRLEKVQAQIVGPDALGQVARARHAGDERERPLGGGGGAAAVGQGGGGLTQQLDERAVGTVVRVAAATLVDHLAGGPQIPAQGGQEVGLADAGGADDEGAPAVSVGLGGLEEGPQARELTCPADGGVVCGVGRAGEGRVGGGSHETRRPPILAVRGPGMVWVATT